MVISLLQSGPVRAGLAALRQPLVIFLIGAAFIFAFDALRPAGPDDEASQIVLSDQQLEKLAAGFQRSWGRAPTEAELSALADGWLQDEVFYRQAVALDLGADDPVIRRYLGNKMRFLSEDSVIVPEAGEAELRAYFETHESAFAPDPEYDLQLVRLPPMGETETASALEALETGAPVQSVLPGVSLETFSAAGRIEISRRYGVSFYEDLANLPAGTWRGPIASSVGVHLVRVDAVQTGDVPGFETVRDEVAERWMRDRREALEQAAFEKLRGHYDLDTAFPGN